MGEAAVRIVNARRQLARDSCRVRVLHLGWRKCHEIFHWLAIYCVLFIGWIAPESHTDGWPKGYWGKEYNVPHWHRDFNVANGLVKVQTTLRDAFDSMLYEKRSRPAPAYIQLTVKVMELYS